MRVFSRIFSSGLIWCILCGGIATARSQQLSEANELVLTKAISATELKKDLDFLFKTIEEVHPNMYVYTSKEEFAKYKDQLYKQINRPMNRREFFQLIAPVVTSLRNLHTRIVMPFMEEYERYSKAGGKVFPLGLSWDESKVTLNKNYSTAALPLGGEVLTINGRTTSELFARFEHWFPAENRHTNPWLIEHPVSLRRLLFFEYGTIESWHLSIKAKEGVINSYTIPSLPLTEFTADEPVATIELEKHYRFIPEYDVALIKFYKWREPEKLKLFWDKAFRDISEMNVSNLIIDIRENTGGSDQCFHPLLEYLTHKPFRLYDRVEMKIVPQAQERIETLRSEMPEVFENKKEGDIVVFELPFQTPADNRFRFGGRTLVLIGRRSFSASTVFASIVKCFKIATLVGEETGDPTTLYADSIHFKLPNSDLEACVASKLLVTACGKLDGLGVLPDYEVKQKPEDIAKGVDTVLQFTLDLIRKSTSEIPQK